MEIAEIKWLLPGSKCPLYICASFKQQAIQREISAMHDAHGNLQKQKSRDGMAAVIKEHVVKLLGTTSQPNEAAVQAVLEAHIQPICDEARAAMEHPITLDDSMLGPPYLQSRRCPGRTASPSSFS